MVRVTEAGTPGSTAPANGGPTPQAPSAAGAERAADQEPATTAGAASAAAENASTAAGDGGPACGRLIYRDYETSEAQHPGCIFAICVRDDERVDLFSHRPYDRWWTMDHEDLLPMHSKAAVRGRLETDHEKRPLLTLKEPQSVPEYFDLKGVPKEDRSTERHVRMVHDEYIRIARKLIATGLAPDTAVEMTGLRRFFPGREDLDKNGPLPLRGLAALPLSTEPNL